MMLDWLALITITMLAGGPVMGLVLLYLIVYFVAFVALAAWLGRR